MLMIYPLLGAFNRDMRQRHFQTYDKEGEALLIVVDIWCAVWKYVSVSSFLCNLFLWFILSVAANKAEPGTQAAEHG